MPPQVTVATQVQVLFTVTDPDRPDGLTYTDALYYPVGGVPANAVVRAAAVTRYQAWRAALDAPRPHIPKAERLRLAQEARDNALAQQAAAAAALEAEEASQEA